MRTYANEFLYIILNYAGCVKYLRKYVKLGYRLHKYIYIYKSQFLNTSIGRNNCYTLMDTKLLAY